MKSTALLRLLAISLACSCLLHAETETTPIPFSEIGTKATVDYQGDAIGITTTHEGARLHTGFQELAGAVTSAGLTLWSTEEGGGDLKLTAISIGRDATVAAQPVSLPTSGNVTIEGTLVRWSRPGLVEEYSVSADGVRQDFIVAAAPTGSGELNLQLAITGASAKSKGDGVILKFHGSGRDLAYTRLHVEDATGRVLNARFEVPATDRLSVRVCDAGAVYPVRIDPTFSDADWVGIGPGMPGVDGGIRALAVDSNGILYVAGDFTFAGNSVANRIAKWNGASWTSVGTGINFNGTVHALATIGTDVYAGGSFTTIGGITVNRVAKWNGSVWSSLGSGVSDTVFSLTPSGTNLYAGGNFVTAGGVTVNRIAKWDGSSWNALGTGMSGGSSVSVLAMAIDGGDIYVGGSFTAAGGVAASNIAKWNGISWSALGTGTNNHVRALGISGATIYAGGTFTTAGGTAANRIARWDGSAWNNLGTGVNGSSVDAIAFFGTDLIVGGNYFQAGGISVGGIARWNGSGWSAMASSPVSTQVLALLSTSGNLYAAGSLSSINTNTGVRGIAMWNGSNWSSLGSGLSGVIHALAVDGEDNLYVGGEFLGWNGLSTNYIAKWDGVGWSSLGGGLSGHVFAIKVHQGDVYAGGGFGVRKWNGSAWTNLGAGSVQALAFVGNDLYAGGIFTTIGGVSANKIAKWNGSSWIALGGGMTGGSFAQVDALATNGTDLFVGGEFTHANGVAANNIAKWNGTTWSGLGSGINNWVAALAMDGGVLYAGGRFSTAGGTAASNVARWNGSSWSAIGNGMMQLYGGAITSIALSGGDLFIGHGYGGDLSFGKFISKWNGSAWIGLGSGLNGSPYALATDSLGNLYVGGDFSVAGVTPSPYVAKANLVSTPTLAPEIAIEQSGSDVPTGSTHPFGSVATGGYLERTFTILNSGTANLTLSGSPRVAKSGSADFTVTSHPASADIAPGGSGSFTVRFTPTGSGPKSATLSIANNDGDENPFVIELTGTATTASALFTDTLTSGTTLTGNDAFPNATPFNDGVENLLKYAFNMNLAGPDASTLPPGTGTSGLPAITTPEDAPPGTLRFEFLRRKGSGLAYTPQKSTSLDGTSWSPLIAAPVVTSINDQWERVVYTEAPDPVPASVCFGRVEVKIP